MTRKVNLSKLFNNDLMQTCIVVFLVVYIAVLSPVMNGNLTKIMGHPLVQLFIIALAVWAFMKDKFILGLLLSILVVINYMSENNLRLFENYENNNGYILSKDGLLDKKYIDKVKSFFGDIVKHIPSVDMEKNRINFKVVTKKPTSDKIVFGLENDNDTEFPLFMMLNGTQINKMSVLDNKLSDETRNDDNYKSFVKKIQSVEFTQLAKPLIDEYNKMKDKMMDKTVENLTTEEFENYNWGHVYDRDQNCECKKVARRSVMKEPLSSPCRGYSYFKNELNAQGFDCPVTGNLGLVGGAPFN